MWWIVAWTFAVVRARPSLGDSSPHIRARDHLASPSLAVQFDEVTAEAGARFAGRGPSLGA